jgi:hypothetical protein
VAIGEGVLAGFVGGGVARFEGSSGNRVNGVLDTSAPGSTGFEAVAGSNVGSVTQCEEVGGSRDGVAVIGRGSSGNRVRACGVLDTTTTGSTGALGSLVDKLQPVQEARNWGGI